VHRRQEQLMPELEAALREAGVELRTGEEAWATEFLDMVMAVRVVDSLDEALDHIARYGTGPLRGDRHRGMPRRRSGSPARWTPPPCTSTRPPASTDGRAVRDGRRDRDLPTNRLHARGPLGLEELTTTKYVVVGDGQVRSRLGLAMDQADHCDVHTRGGPARPLGRHVHVGGLPAMTKADVLHALKMLLAKLPEA
jgi:glutamate-5-semialdehyde dehydrogenase